MKSAIFLFTIFNFHFSLATSMECPTFNLQSETSSIPYFDQGSTRFCYAYSASYLANFYFQNQWDLSLQVNPLSVSAGAMRVSQGQQSPSNIWGGHLSHGLTAISRGVCSVRSDNLGTGRLEVSPFLEELRKIYVESKSSNGEDTLLRLDSFYREAEIDTAQLPSPNILQELTRSTSTAFISELLNRLCTKRSFPPLPAEIKIAKRELIGGSREFAGLVATELSKKNPLGLHFCSEIILDSDFELTSYNQVCNEHYAVITGQRLNEHGVCEIQLQDSQCSFYNNQSSNRCHQGEVWVERELIFKTLKNLHWLDK